MYELLELYARPYRAHEPVICIDEKSKQLIRDSRPSLGMKPGAAAKYDYEYAWARWGQRLPVEKTRAAPFQDGTPEWVTHLVSA
jgi:hypothetical protein